MSQGQLHRSFLNNSDYVLHKWIHYFDIYERHFSRFVNEKPTIEEEIHKNRYNNLMEKFLGDKHYEHD